VFGSIYSNHTEVLRDSLDGMNEDYRRLQTKGTLEFLQRLYIRSVGIPEIGFRLRGLYFRQALGRMSANPKRVLDAGSGIGANTITLARRYPGATVVGCDIDQAKTAFCIGFAQELGVNNAQFLSGDVTDLGGLGPPFDVVVCVDVLEHVVDYRAALEAFNRILRPGGMLYVHTPQAEQKRMFRRLRNWQHRGHAREGFSRDGLTGALEHIGFAVVEARQTFGPFGSLAWELNHITLAWNLGVAGVVFPLLYAFARLDPIMNNANGLGLSVIARKVDD
jgi:2-polyprenyl-3-methyl-5-hydroxy-6-metoxy-1,4-benzoquinol methylase